MEEEKTEEILRNTEEISENTEQIKKIGIRQYSLERHKRIWEALFYAHQRMDILIISISGGGIYVSLEVMKYLNEKGLCIDYLLKYSALSFVIAIITNFIAQKMSSNVYFSDYQISDIEVTCDEEQIDKNEHQIHIDKLDKKSKSFDFYNKIFNWSSICFMSLGLIFLIVFFLVTF